MGHTRISTQALTSLARVAAAEAFDVAPQSVRITWTDDAGELALSLSSPMSAPNLNLVAANPDRVRRSGGSILERSTAAKESILRSVEALSGSKLSRVDIRISGLVLSEGRVVE